MRADQRQPGIECLPELGQGGGAQTHAQHQCQSAKCTKPAVAHDRELGFAVATAGEPVDGVGEAVLVQCAGQREPAQQSEQRCRPGTKTEKLGEQQDEGRDRADAGANQREGPGGIGEPAAFGCRHGYRDAGQKAGGDGKTEADSEPTAGRILGAGQLVPMGFPREFGKWFRDDPAVRRITMDEPVANLDEIRALLRALPGPDLAAGTAASLRQAQLTKPQGSLGRLEELAVWLATWQGRPAPRLDRPRVAVFAANHGVAARGVSAYPASVTAQMVQNFIAGGAAINQLCRVVDADLKVYEMNLDNPTGDIVDGPAMSDAECAKAMAYGMMAVEPGIDALAVGEMGIGNTTVAAALCAGLFGGGAELWTGPGSGVAGAALDAKRRVVAAAVARHREAAGDPFHLLCRLGGLELAAITGAVMASRLGRVPVVLDGFVSTAAAAVLFAADRHALDHCVVAHVSAEPGHRHLLERIGMAPLFDFGMRLGEASGAALALSILKAAAACHNGMATFAEAGVSGPA